MSAVQGAAATEFHKILYFVGSIGPALAGPVNGLLLPNFCLLYIICADQKKLLSGSNEGWTVWTRFELITMGFWCGGAVKVSVTDPTNNDG